MQTVKFYIKINPIPYYRRVVRKNGQTYNPPEYEGYKNAIAAIAQQQMRKDKRELLTADLRVSYRFYRKNGIRVDFDNLKKAVNDAFQGKVFKNDSQIIENGPGFVLKKSPQFGIEPHLEVVIEELPGGYNPHEYHS